MALRDWIRAQSEKYADDEVERRTQLIETRSNEYGYDPFGFHPASLRSAAPLVQFLHRSYFRTEVHGIENVPATGRTILVANHSGQLPFDGLIIGASVFLDAEPPRVVRSMIERFIPTLPFVSYILNRWGQITGTPENCRRLLHNEEIILVFPEGTRGISKPFTDRYQLERFGTGFMRLALETDTQIVPVAVIGAEEQAPAINIKSMAKFLRAPAFPVMPFPPFVPLPLPVKYRVYFGEPMHFDGSPDEDEDDMAIKIEAIRNRLQSLIHVGLRSRRHVFW